MSFGYFDERTGLLYGSKDINMLLARRRNLASLDFWRMVKGILKFWKKFPAAYEAGELKSKSLYDFVDGEYSAPFVQHYLIPFAAAIWSASGDEVLDMPAEHCARFFINHGMLSYSDNPQWQTVVGGSHSYLKVFEKEFTGSIRRSDGVKSIRRSELGVDVETLNGESVPFDSVVVATHADQALGLLSDPSDEEVRLLGAWKYSQNRTVLHTDTSFLPPNPRGVAAWNYRRFLGESDQEPVCLTYHMNTLQGLTSKTEYCVTLNPRKPIAENSIVREFNYTHPIFDDASFATQSHLPSLNGVNRTWFCGSYFRWGFHEDAIRSAVGVANDFGVLL
jgi:predicted NAD/FAD-binding protein